MAVEEDVGSDLRERAFEQDDAEVIDRSARALTQQVDRAVEGFEALFEAGQDGVKLEGLPGGGRLRNR